MFRLAIASLTALSLAAGLAGAADQGGKKVSSALDFDMKTLDGKDANLAQYRGKVVLFVNVASRCGYTPQYEGLQALYQKYGKDGLVIVGVPANNFGKQEPGSNEEIAQFCSSKYGVTFPMLAKVSVKGGDITPLYQYLTTHANPKGDVSWNFEKFLINKNGAIVGRYKSKVTPDAPELTQAIETELKK
jgi:glutathione peroxidase